MKLIVSKLCTEVRSGHSLSKSSTGGFAQHQLSVMLNKLRRSVFRIALWLALSASSIEAATIYGLTVDREVNSDGTMNDVTPMLAGFAGTTPIPTNAVMVFQLPTLPAGQKFAAANLSFYMGKNGTPTYNGDLYGLPVSASSTVSPSSFYVGAADPTATLIQDNLFTPAMAAGTITTSSAVLADYLNNAYANGTGAGKYVFFRINPDANVTWVWTRYTIASAEDPAGASHWPTLTYTTASTWDVVPLGGGGFITGLVSSSGGDIYARTDCGGAFRWDSVNGVWHSITDTMVDPSTPDSNAAMSIPSLAVDPNNSNQLYVAAGDFTWATVHGIYSSSDKGATWTQINSNIIMNGQGQYRGRGERLAVDPNNSNILWFGSTQDGLQKGVRSGTTWTWTQVPSTSVPFGATTTTDKGGITFVACDKNGGSTIVYAGVFDSVGSTGGIYKSTDGVNWIKVSGITLTGPSHGQVATNGTLYVTQGGVVAKMLRSGTLQDITPVAGVSYGGIAVDPNDSTGNTLYVAESINNQFGRIWRTTNGGAPWAQQYQNMNNQNYTRTEPDGTPTLTGYWFGNVSSLLVNPTNSHELFVGDFFGVARTEDAQDLGTTSGSFWYMIQKNQEQTCPECLLTAPTGPLMVGHGDVGGFQYLDTSARPTGTAGTPFTNPSGGSDPGMDFAESNNNIWARTWLRPDQKSGSGAVSGDGGTTWTKFGELAEHVVITGAPGWETWDVGDYLAKQKAKGNNTVTLAICCGNSINPLWSTGGILFDSREGGATNAPQLSVNGTITLTATADSYVDGANVTTNYGAATNLITSYKANNVANSRWIYLKFDLSSVATITSATLQLHRQNEGASTWSIGVYACTNTTWAENTIAWSGRPVTLANGDTASAYDPNTPAYFDGATLLCGGRIAISSTDPTTMVWLPQGAGTVPHYSRDRGISWTACTSAPGSQMTGRDNPGTSLQQLASDRVNGKFYLAKFNGGSGGNHTVYSSPDGAAWALAGTVATGSYNLYHSQIVAAPAINDVWVCDDGTGTTPAHSGIWRSTNGGVNWSQVGSGVITQVREVSFGKALSGSGYTVFIAGYKSGVRGIYRSDDYGATWVALSSLPTDSDIQVLAGDRQNYGMVFFGANGRGVYQGQ